MVKIALKAVLLLALLVAGCAGDDEVVTGPGDGSSPGDGSDDATGRPGGGDGPLFVSIEMGGGFVPVGHDFRSLPQAVVYDDGTTYSPGAVIAIYPGPAVLPVTEGQLGDGELQEILEAAVDAGLTDDSETDFGEPPVADATTTTITVVVDGEEHTVSVYALGLDGADLPGIDADAAAARERVQSFVDLVSGLVTGAEEGEYEPERYRILPLEPQPQTDEGVEPEVRDWPLDDVELALRQCTAVDGDDAAQLRAALQDANEITRWQTASGEVFSLVVRPVLPHEPDCPTTSS